MLKFSGNSARLTKAIASEIFVKLNKTVRANDGSVYNLENHLVRYY